MEGNLNNVPEVHDVKAIVRNVSAIICLVLILSNVPWFINTANADTPIMIYAAPDGNGSDCDLASPCSIQSAMEMVRTLNGSMTGDIIVVLSDGTYELTEPLILTSEDSGKNGHRIVYRAAVGATPVFSGGMTISDWTEEGDNWVTNIGQGLEIRQLFINSERAVRARSADNPGGFTETATGYTTSDSQMAGWGNPEDIEIVSLVQWRAFRCKVATIDGNQITMQPGCWRNAQMSRGTGYDISMNLPTWIENAIELLDEPGEWYYDRLTGDLTYKPKPGETIATASIIAPKLETIVKGAGTPDAPVENIVFEGITFAYGTWLGMSGEYGYASVQAGFHQVGELDRFSYEEVEKIGESVDISFARNVSFVRNRFMHLGGAALGLSAGSQGNTIVGNVFSDISASAIQLGGVKGADSHPDDTRKITRDNTISNNVISDIGVEYYDTVGIFTGYAENTEISHNELTRMPYTGISIGWGWGAADHPDFPTISKDNKIRANLIYDYMNRLLDGGGIYSLGAQRNMIISENVLHGQHNVHGAYYLDDGSKYVTIENNVAYDNVKNLIINGGSDNIVRNNYWDDDSRNMNGPPGANVFENNTIAVPGTFPLQIVNNAGLQPAFYDIAPRITTGNLAQGATVYGYDGNGDIMTFSAEKGAAAITDHDLSTFAESGVPGEWAAMVDLGRIYAIDAVVVGFPADRAPAAYKVEITGDGTDWEVVLDSVQGRDGRNVIPLAGQHVRNIRVTSLDGGMAIAEIEAYAPGTAVPMAAGFTAAIAIADAVYASSTPHVTIDEDGVMTAQSEGGAAITAQRNDRVWDIEIVVEQASDIRLFSDLSLLPIGAQARLALSAVTAAGLRLPYAPANISYAVDDPLIVSVDAQGVATGLAEGDAVVTASTNVGGSAIARSIALTVFKPTLERVEISLSRNYYHASDTESLQIDAYDNTGTRIHGTAFDRVTFDSDDANIAAINEDGLVTAVAAGRTVVRAEIEVDGTVQTGMTEVQVFPDDWEFSTVQNAIGSAVYDNGKWTVRERGYDIFDTRDEFAFVYKEINSADYPDGVSVITTVESLTETVHVATMTGLMLRQSLSPGAKNVNYRIHGSGGAEQKNVPFTFRNDDGAFTDYFMTHSLSLPAKLKLTYKNNLAIAHYWDDDDEVWKQAGLIDNLDLGATFYVGVAHTSNNPLTFTETEFSDTYVVSAADVSPIYPITISAGTNLLQLNDSLQLSVTGRGQSETLQFTSDNEAVATVDANGLVTAHAPGQVTISVQAYENGVPRLEEGSTSLQLIVYEDINDLVVANVALGKQAAAVTPDFRNTLDTWEPASYGNDGNAATGTTANGRYDWTYKVDLGSVQSVNKLAVLFGPEHYATEFEFVGSLDGISWEVIDSFSNTTGGVSYTSELNALKPLRYAAVRALKPNGPFQTGIEMKVMEFEVYGLVAPVKVEGVSLNASELALYAGQNYQLTATVTPANATNRHVVWSSDNSAVATVDANGNVTGVGPGTAVITATTADGGKTAAATVTVTLASPLAISAATSVMEPEETQATIVTGKKAGETLQFASSNETVATVDSSGVVTALQPGQTTVTVQAIADGTVAGEASLLVLVAADLGDLAYVNIGLHQPAAALMPDMQTVSTAWDYAPVGGANDGNWGTGTQSNQRYDWVYRIDLGSAQSVYGLGTTMDPQRYATEFEFLISVDGVNWEVVRHFTNTTGGVYYDHEISGGKVTRYAAIRALKPDGPNQPGGQMEVKELVVFGYAAVPAESVALSQTSAALEVGGSLQLIATVTPANATNRHVVWSSDNSAVATVDANGNVTGVGPGTAVITATTADGGKTAAANLAVAAPKSLAKPAKPFLSDNNGHDNGLRDGDFTIKMNLWYGDNGSIYRLYENGVLIDYKILIDNSPNPQQVATYISGKSNGTYEYVAELANSFGTTASDKHIVIVTDANPGKPVLSNDNWDQDGNYHVSMNMWWGTNATRFNLYENGDLIFSQDLTPRTPWNQFSATYLEGRAIGEYVYRGELINAAGASFSDEMIIFVKH